MPFLKFVAILSVGISQAVFASPGVEVLTEDSCAFLLSADGKESEVVEVPGLSVLHPPADQPRFVVDQVDGAALEAIICRRSRPEFALIDHRVIEAGFPLYVKSGEGEEEKTLVMHRTTVGHHVRLVSGTDFSESEKERLVSVIDALNTRGAAQRDSGPVADVP